MAVFRVVVSRESEPALFDVWLAGKRALTPGPLLEMAIAAIQASHPSNHRPIVLSDVDFSEVLYLETERKIALTTTVVGEEADFRFQITADVGDRHLTLCAGSCRPSASLSKGSTTLVPLETAPERLGQEDIAFRLHGLGVDLGTRRQCIQSLEIDANSAHANLSANQYAWTGEEHFVAHPALLDGALLSLQLVRAHSQEFPERVHRIREMVIARRLTRDLPARCRIRLTPGTTEEVEIFSSSGDLLVSMRGVEFFVTDRKGFDGKSTDEFASDVRPLSEAGWFLEPEWRDQPLSPGMTKSPQPEGRSILVWLDNESFAQGILSQLRARGNRLVVLSTAEHFLQRPNGSFGLCPTAAEDWESLRDVLRGSADEPTTFLDIRTLTSSLDASRKCQSAILAFVTCIQHFLQGAASVRDYWLVTAGSQGVIHGEFVDPFQAPLWGIARVLAKELDRLRVHCLDLDGSPGRLTTWREENAIASILAELSSSSTDPRIAYRKGVRKTPCLRTLEGDDFVDARPLRLPPDGTYLITGGQGGIGLEIARWLSSRGRPRLLLANRTPLPSEETWNRLEHLAPEIRARVKSVQHLRQLGVDVVPCHLDVTDDVQIARFFERLRRDPRPLDGIFHCAGVLRDRTLANLDPMSLESVLAPKIQGSWNLHQWTRDLHLSAFVLCSSLASVTASEGQANHAAANAFQDALAHYRRDVLGLPTMAINWGYWCQTGVVSQPSIRAALAGKGVLSITNRQGILALEHALRLDKPQLIVAPAIWDRLGMAVDERDTSWKTVAKWGIDAAGAGMDTLVEEAKSWAGVDDALDELAAKYAAKALSSLGVAPLDRGTERIHSPSNLENVLPLYRRLVHRLSDQLAKPYSTTANAREPSELLERAREMFPEAWPLFELLSRCGEALGEVVTGKKNPVGVLFPEGDSERVSKVYTDSPMGAVFR
ncbi:MAG: SDR family NAD(P)-dependent oxidoreductase [Planctomycetota bacterium]